MAREVVSQLESLGHKVVRMWAGHMMTSLEMAGVLVSILKVSHTRDSRLYILDKPLYQARESSLVPLCVHPVQFMHKT